MICTDQLRLVVWYLKRNQPEITNNFRAIGNLNSKGEIVGCFAYDYWTGNSCEMHVVGDEGFIDRTFLWVAFDYPFNKVKCKQVLGRINSANKKVLRFAEHLGFKQIHVIPDIYPNGDQITLRMYKHECKWLETKYVQRLKCTDTA